MNESSGFTSSPSASACLAIHWSASRSSSIRDAGRRHPPGLGFVAQVDGRCHPAHVANLEVEDDEVGLELSDRGPYIDTGADPADVVVSSARAAKTSSATESASVASSTCGTALSVIEAICSATHCGGTSARNQYRKGRRLHAVPPSGELDAYTVGQFREALTALAEEPRLLIDLSEVPFMDSAGLGALIGGIRRAREADGEVVVACSRPTLTDCCTPPGSTGSCP